MDFGILLGSAFQVFVAGLHERMAERGHPVLGASYGFVLRTLADAPTTASVIAERLGITPQGAAKVVDEMVGYGYVERHRDPEDKRAKLLHLSPGGHEMLALIREFHAEFEQTLISEVGVADIAATRAVLERIVATSDPDLAKLFRPL